MVMPRIVIARLVVRSGPVQAPWTRLRPARSPRKRGPNCGAALESRYRGNERIAVPPASGRHRDRAHVLRHLVAALHRGTRGDGLVPALHVRILLEVDGLPLEARDPRPDGNVGDRIIVGDEFT